MYMQYAGRIWVIFAKDLSNPWEVLGISNYSHLLVPLPVGEFEGCLGRGSVMVLFGLIYEAAACPTHRHMLVGFAAIRKASPWSTENRQQNIVSVGAYIEGVGGKIWPYLTHLQQTCALARKASMHLSDQEAGFSVIVI